MVLNANQNVLSVVLCLGLGGAVTPYGERYLCVRIITG